MAAFGKALSTDLASDRLLARGALVRLVLAHLSVWLALIWAHVAIAVLLFELPSRVPPGPLLMLAVLVAGGWLVLALWLLRGALLRFRGLARLAAVRETSTQALTELRAALRSPGLRPGIWLALGLMTVRVLFRKTSRPKARGWLVLGVLMRMALRVAASRVPKTQDPSRASPGTASSAPRAQQRH